MFRWRVLVKPLLIGVACITPYALAMLQLGKNYDLGRMTTAEYLPQNNFVRLSNYFHDSAWHWGETYLRMTVEIGKPLIVLCAICLVGYFSTKIRKPNAVFNGIDRTAIAVVLVIGSSAALLQTKLSTPIYRYLPGASYIQFPWRLEALLVPALIASCTIVLSKLQRKGTSVLLVVVAVSMLATAGSFAHIRYEWMTYQASDSDQLQFSAFNEYVPVSAGSFSQNRYSEILRFNAQNGCTLSTLQREVESTERTYSVHCTGDALVVMPEFSSAAHRVQIDTDNQVRCIEDQKNPGLCAIRVKAGNHIIHMHYPTLLGVLYSLIN
jgi:hypothetical protein